MYSTPHTLFLSIPKKYERRARLLLAKRLLWLTLIATPTLHASDQAQIFHEAPSPDKLADILFKPRYRSVVINNQPAQKPLPKLFGMLVNFEFNSVNIVPESRPLLDTVGKMMQLNRTAEKQIIIEGHTDAIGTQQYNQQLSEQRAQAIKRYLVSRFQIEPARLVVVGKGENELYDKRKPTKAINRRVQFRALEPIG